MNTVKTLWQTQHALIVTLLGLLVAPLSAKFGIQLDPAVLYSTIGLIAVYVAGHHYKEAAIAAAKIAAGVVDQLPTPKPIGESPITKIALLLLLVGVALPGTARASGLDWSTGPTLPFLEYDFGNPHPVQVAPGAGVQLSVTHDALKRAFLGKSWDLLDLQLSAFGSVVSAQSGQQFGAFSGAVGVGLFSSLVSINGGKHLLGADQSFTHGGWFMGLALNLNVALSLSAPPAGVENGPAGMPRGNTLYLGSP